MKRSLLLAVLPLTLLALPVALTAGCGGADNPGSFLATTGGSASSPFASRSFNSTVALGTDQTGAVALNVAADGRTATGTLTVSSTRAQTGTRQTQNFSFAVGTYRISGTVDATTGAFTMTGSAGGEPFSFDGTLPTPGNGNIGGAYTLTAGGETYNGSFATTATPTPATGATPTPTPTSTPPATGSGNFAFNIVSKSADCNLDESLISGLKITASKYTPASAVPVAGYNAYGLTFTADKKVGDDSGTFNITYVYTKAGVIVPQTFTFKPEIDLLDSFSVPFGVGITTSDVNVNGTSFSIVINQWRPSGGSLIVESVSGKTIVVRGENVTFAPLTGPNLSSKGTFTANFTVTLTNVDGL